MVAEPESRDLRPAAGDVRARADGQSRRRDRLGRSMTCWCLNFANPDMVGHSGSLPAAIKAVASRRRRASGASSRRLKKQNGALDRHRRPRELRTHARSPDGRPAHTAHTTNPVPVVVMGSDAKTGFTMAASPTLRRRCWRFWGSSNRAR